MSRSKKSAVLAFLLAAGWLVLVLVPRRARAESAADATGAADAGRTARLTELNEAGAKLYRERNYRRAIEKFIEAYALDHDPNLLFNVARCYEELGDTTAAIEKYTAYINAPGADASGRVRAEQSLRALRELQRRAASDAKTAKPAPPTSEPPAATAAADAAAPSDGSGTPTQTILAWSALGAGALVAGVSATVFYLGMRDHDRVTGAPGYGDPAAAHPLTMAEARDLIDSGDRKKLTGGIGLALGGALVATSVALFLLPSAKDAREPASSFALGWAPGASGFRAAWTVRF
jgi:tetratricopeptide (TPR) repeat protein